MDEDSLIWDELERLARAHLVAEQTIVDTEVLDSVEVSPDIAKTLKEALDSRMTGSLQDMTAIVSVPSSTPVPAEWLFRLDPPVTTPAALEHFLGLEKKTLRSVSALKMAGDERSAATVDFVFITHEMKAQIERLVKDETLKISPLFVKVTKTALAG